MFAKDNEIVEFISPSSVILTIDNDKTTRQILAIESIQLKVDENKKPIFGYGDRHFHKVLSGKTICSGVLVIKKISKNTLADFLSKNDERVLESVRKNLGKRIDFLYELQSTALRDSKTSLVASSTLKELALNNTENHSVEKFKDYEVELEIARRIASIKDKSYNNNDDVLLKLGHKSELTFNVYYDKENIQNVLKLKNLHFISKQENILGHNSDVSEIYEFISNIERK